MNGIGDKQNGQNNSDSTRKQVKSEVIMKYREAKEKKHESEDTFSTGISKPVASLNGICYLKGEVSL